MESLPNFYMEEITDADLDEIFGPMEVEEQTLEATPETEVSRVRFACLNEQQLVLQVGTTPAELDARQSASVSGCDSCRPPSRSLISSISCLCFRIVPVTHQQVSVGFPFSCADDRAPVGTRESRAVDVVSSKSSLDFPGQGTGKPGDQVELFVSNMSGCVSIPGPPISTTDGIIFHVAADLARAIFHLPRGGIKAFLIPYRRAAPFHFGYLNEGPLPQASHLVARRAYRAAGQRCEKQRRQCLIARSADYIPAQSPPLYPNNPGNGALLADGSNQDPTPLHMDEPHHVRSARVYVAPGATEDQTSEFCMMISHTKLDCLAGKSLANCYGEPGEWAYSIMRRAETGLVFDCRG
ncbi:hypothetical protein Bbelb_005630 [Branchiostoma belcheri]|nr:hypothetical protein Bbelb_005630 [Branchiostoma belcheri]